MSLKLLPEKQWLSYSAMQWQIKELSKYVNLITQIEAKTIEPGAAPLFTFSEEVVKLEMPNVGAVVASLAELKEDYDESIAKCDAANVVLEEQVTELEEDVEELCDNALPTGTWSRSLVYCFSLGTRTCDQQNVSLYLGGLNQGTGMIEVFTRRYAVYLGSTDNGNPFWAPGLSLGGGWVVSMRLQYGGTVTSVIDISIDRTYDVWFKDISGTPDTDTIIDSFTVEGGVITFSENPCDE